MARIGGEQAPLGGGAGDPATAVLRAVGPDRKGLVAVLADFVYRHGGNITHADQHVDAEAGVFFQRVEFHLDGFGLGRDEILPDLTPVTEPLGMRCEVRFSDEVARTAVLVTREAHCLYDLLARQAMGELQAEIACVVANHPDLEDVAARFDVPFHHLPVTAATRVEQEGALLDLLARERVDLVVLARYMQILTSRVIDAHAGRIINIHHSFLPAFLGGRPYHQAHERGVKLIGATAHYATAQLDQGPIIDQDVVRVSHRDGVADLVRKGRDLETVVLARALTAHLEHRVLVHGRKTLVF
ncbi:MAG TPA: formyltetrahydrofolate deformylase [Acidimicrobiales bacterium]|nr:formyltetrahydrofolate deformylase [Acidimicrobiales bacterium]